MEKIHDETIIQELKGNKWQNYKYILSKNGKYLLLYEGFAYRKYMTSKARQSYWTCTLRGCKAKATMKPDGWFTLSKYTHNHEPNYEEMERKAIKAELRKLTLETELSPTELLRQVGLEDDPDKKYRDTINFWRWRARRKTEAESPGYYEDSKKLQLDDDYKFIRTQHSHFLQYKNYLYRKYMSSKMDSGSYWRCRRDDCPARAKLDSSALLTCMNFNHNHPEEEIEGEDMEQDIRQNVREMAMNTDLPVNEILKMFNSEEDAELRKYIKNIRIRKQRSSREKKQKVEETVINQIEMLENVPPGNIKVEPEVVDIEIKEEPIEYGQNSKDSKQSPPASQVWNQPVVQTVVPQYMFCSNVTSGIVTQEYTTLTAIPLEVPYVRLPVPRARSKNSLYSKRSGNKKLTINDYTFRESQKGHLILQQGGYDYRFGTATATTLRWRCCREKKFKCTGRAIIENETGDISIKEHNHPPYNSNEKKLFELNDLFDKP